MRNKLIKQLSDLYEKACDLNLDAAAEDILIRNNASQDDSGEEGFMSTMSNTDIQNAIYELRKLSYSMDSNSAQSLIYSFLSGGEPTTDQYAMGFLDACRILADEYDLPLDGLE